MTRKKQRKGPKPGAAVVLLLVCMGIAAFSLKGQFGGGTSLEPVAGEAMLDDADTDVGDAATDAAAPSVDLLLRHGSWSDKEPVRMSFVSVIEAAAAAAPAGETAASAAARWVGADPPSMRLGVLMIGDTVRRAVVDGRIVGVGDTVGKALIIAIERDTVTATWGGKRLTYDLDGDQPREFRAERKRRGSEPNAASAGATDQIQESK